MTPASGVGADRFRAMTPGDPLEGVDPDAVRLIPGDALELAGATRPDAALGIEQPLVGIDHLGGARAARTDHAQGMAAQGHQALDPVVP